MTRKTTKIAMPIAIPTPFKEPEVGWASPIESSCFEDAVDALVGVAIAAVCVTGRVVGKPPVVKVDAVSNVRPDILTRFCLFWLFGKDCRCLILHVLVAYGRF